MFLAIYSLYNQRQIPMLRIILLICSLVGLISVL
nr:MAG TPA: hypothetical protein [Caudoviricetes sp.]